VRFLAPELGELMDKKLKADISRLELDLQRKQIQAGFAALEEGEFSEDDLSKIGELSAGVKERGRKRLEAEAISGI
jgi:hypothetical protein